MKKLGFGCMRFPTLDGDSKQIDKETVCRMFDAFLAAGFTYVDTAYPYHGGQSELAVKECLVQRHPRSSFLLADKLPMVRVKSAEDLPRFFDEQIEKCGVEYFDYYLLHNLGKENYAKSLETKLVTVEHAQPIMIIFIAVLPVAIFLFGLVLWIKRRKL